MSPRKLVKYRRLFRIWTAACVGQRNRALIKTYRHTANRGPLTSTPAPRWKPWHVVGGIKVARHRQRVQAKEKLVERLRQKLLRHEERAEKIKQNKAHKAAVVRKRDIAVPRSKVLDTGEGDSEESSDVCSSADEDDRMFKRHDDEALVKNRKIGGSDVCPDNIIGSEKQTNILLLKSRQRKAPEHIRLEWQNPRYDVHRTRNTSAVGDMTCITLNFRGRVEDCKTCLYRDIVSFHPSYYGDTSNKWKRKLVAGKSEGHLGDSLPDGSEIRLWPFNITAVVRDMASFWSLHNGSTLSMLAAARKLKAIMREEQCIDKIRNDYDPQKPDAVVDFWYYLALTKQAGRGPPGPIKIRQVTDDANLKALGKYVPEEVSDDSFCSATSSAESNDDMSVCSDVDSAVSDDRDSEDDLSLAERQARQKARRTKKHNKTGGASAKKPSPLGGAYAKSRT